MTQPVPYRVLFVEAIGGHRGMHYYDLALCGALAKQGVDVTLFTCDKTSVPSGLPFAVKVPFQGVFGDAPAWRRGLRYALALACIARHRPHDMPAIVHVHFFHALPLDYVFLAWMRARGARLVITAHDVIPFDIRIWSLPFLHRIYGMAQGIIVHTQSGHVELSDQGIVRPEWVQVIPIGNYLLAMEDMPSRSEARQRLGLPANAPVILFFGQIKEVKGLDVLLQALPHLAIDHPTVQLVIAGKLWKDDWSRYSSIIDRLNLANRLTLHLHHVPDDEVGAFFAAADVVALPYRHVYQSGVLLMTMSCGRPVVATQVGGLAEVVQDGETGYLVPPGDPVALAKAIDRILDDPEAAQAMGQRAQAVIREEYSWPRIAALTRQVYEQSLTRGCSR